MVVSQCKQCAGRLVFDEAIKGYVCEYCGSIHTEDDKINEDRVRQCKERANRLFLACDFDGAASLYQAVVTECTEDAESYWFLALCTYGVQFVDVNDPGSMKKVPTCHRTMHLSILNNEDYLNALECATAQKREEYERTAAYIDQVQQGILRIVQNEQPYDIFLCYKETDHNGLRTREGDLARDLYYKLTSEGYRVFFAPITLQSKAGSEFEPYIFAALNSVKLMLVIGFSTENLNSPWVKNEWSRFLARKARNPRLLLVCCYNSYLMDASQLPVELSKMQARDLANSGTGDLVEDVKKWLPRKTESVTQASVTSAAAAQGSNAAALCKRGYVYIEDRQFKEAETYFNKCLDLAPEMSIAYWGLVLSKLRCVNDEELVVLGKPIEQFLEYKKAMRFASGAEQDRFQQVTDRINEKIRKTIAALEKRRYESMVAVGAHERAAKETEEMNAAVVRCDEYIRQLRDIEASLQKEHAACENALKPILSDVLERAKQLSGIGEHLNAVKSLEKSDMTSLIARIEEIAQALEHARTAAAQTKQQTACFATVASLLRKQQELMVTLERERMQIERSTELLGTDYETLKEIEERFAPAFEKVRQGEYVLAKELLAQG